MLIRVKHAVCLVEEFSCSLADHLERREEWVFSWNNIVVLSGLGMESLRLPSREAEGINLSQGSVSSSTSSFSCCQGLSSVRALQVLHVVII